MKKFFLLFTKHPSSVNESYLEHFLQTIRISCKLAKSSIIVLTHGLFPFLFTSKTTKDIESLYKTTKRRADMPQGKGTYGKKKGRPSKKKSYSKKKKK